MAIETPDLTKYATVDDPCPFCGAEGSIDSIDDDSGPFDPTRHRVWEVNATISYTTYVVAMDREEAEKIAERHQREDRDYAAATFDATEVKADVVQGEDGTLPWGPIQWSGRELTVNEALDLIREEPQEPLVVLPEKAFVPDPRIAEWLSAARSRPARGVTA